MQIREFQETATEDVAPITLDSPLFIRGNRCPMILFPRYKYMSLICALLFKEFSSASVVVDEETVGNIGMGLLALIGVEEGDTDSDVAIIAEKLIGLRIFEDAEGKMKLAFGQC